MQAETSRARRVAPEERPVTTAKDPSAPIRGLWCATLTPVDRAGRFDAPRLVDHLHFLFEHGVAGAALFGTTGEGPSFSAAERMAGLDAVLARGISADRLCAATGAASWTDTIEVSRHAIHAGVRRCLVLPPFYYSDLHEDWVFACYADLVDTLGSAGIQVYLYHIPRYTGVSISAKLLERLAAAFPKHIAGVKDSGADWTHTRSLLEHAPQLAILVGHEPHLPQAMRAGAAGTICGVANVDPGLVRHLLAKEVSRDEVERIERFVATLFEFPFIAAFKAMKAAQVRDAAWCAVRRPLAPLGRDQQKALAAAMEGAGFGPLVHARR